jgi:hypothetical protein
VSCARRSRAASCFVINMMVPSVTHVLNLVMTFGSSSHWECLVTDEEYAAAAVRGQQQQQQPPEQHLSQTRCVSSSNSSPSPSDSGSRPSRGQAAEEAADDITLNSSNGSCKGGSESCTRGRGSGTADHCRQLDLRPQSTWGGFDHALYR